ncbi:acyl carrier protein [Amycolatopsis sp. RTGN1]|jgi:acyl carrier protein|uniref:acyl carrier protein n=1 Tax=Amycolatopsis ponsaeliensis TaxID=2992142 RepID=UPI002549D014|nr:phosphopantetheine-binding protein [Amycolatopsis sp. RTGN1]
MDPRMAELLTPFLKFLNGRELGPDDSLRERGLDSMQSINVLFEIEDVFGVSLPDEDITDATFATPATLWTAVSAQLKLQGVSS